MPPETRLLDYSAEFSTDEFAKIARGLTPESMEDKWVIALEGQVLSFHRSWSGICVYQVELLAATGCHLVRSARVNRDAKQYPETDAEYDAKLLHFLISNLLLGQSTEFPAKAGSTEALKGLVQHHSSGTAYPEQAPETKKPWWKFW